MAAICCFISDLWSDGQCADDIEKNIKSKSNVKILNSLKYEKKYEIDNKNAIEKKLLKDIKDIKGMGDNNRIYFEYGEKFTNLCILPNHDKMDHQGHIIPQNMIARMLIPDHQKLLSTIGKNSGCPKQFAEHMKDNWGQYHFSHFIDYNEGLLYTESTPREILSNVYSKIIWLPANICRAPEDEDRHDGGPKEKIDEEVLGALGNLNYPMFDLLLKAKEFVSKDNYEGFMKVWKQLLANAEQNKENRYYRFHWKKLDNEKFKPITPIGIIKEYFGDETNRDLEEILRDCFFASYKHSTIG